MLRQEYSAELQSVFTHLGWQGRLNEAATREDVVAIARDYMALWSPDELSCLPPDLRPGKIVDADDVSDCALRLVQAQMDRGTEAETHVHKLGGFFSSASLRLAQIMACASEVSSEHAGYRFGYGR
jgi:hypothetical protein